jgi:deazaflavin-dependent oxidoreductase (nitroreductase family)
MQGIILTAVFTLTKLYHLRGLNEPFGNIVSDSLAVAAPRPHYNPLTAIPSLWVDPRMKRHIVHVLQKYLLNPPIKFLFAIGLALPGYALLETTGCKTGKLRRTPVGNGLVGKQFWLVAEHGPQAGYVRNIAANPRVRLKLRDGLRARWFAGTAQLLFLDDPHERQRWLANQLPSSTSNAAAVRFFGTQLLTVRIDLDS